MRFAKNENGNKIEVQFSGQRAMCQCCNSIVIGRVGEIRPKHWFHKSTKDCDSWYEPITEWHIDWQNYFPKDNQEIYLIDKEQNHRHRADVRLNNGIILEVQNSAININEIEQRENFYTKNGKLIWILNGGNLLKNCSINYKHEKKEHSLSISIPEYIEGVKYYSYDEIRDDLIESKSINKLKSENGFSGWEILNGSYLIFYFENNIDFYSAIQNIKEDAFEVTEKHYSKHIREIMWGVEFYHTSISKDRFVEVNLAKLYWRQFIDKMKSPVFIENIKGLSKNHLYYYQKNTIVEKEEFLFNVQNNKY